VRPEAGFLISLGQTLATMSLYNEGHPARQRALDASYDQLLALTADQSCMEYSFLGGETVAGTRPLVELGSWDWAAKLAAANVERIEIDSDVSRDSYDRFVDELFQRVSGRAADTAEARQMAHSPIRFGQLRVKGPRPGLVESAEAIEIAGGEGPLAPAGLSLAEEVEAVGWIHGQIEAGSAIPMLEVELVARSLAAAMHGDGRVLLPLLQLKEYDQYTTTHALNVAVLAMALSERLGLGPAEVRSFGVSGLLHDIGKVKIPRDLLTKPGRFTDAERQIVQRHPVDGASLILERERGLGLAAVVAYEHHIFLNGGGYPARRYGRGCHYASRITHVCDVYDALCTDRPYRRAWPSSQALGYLEEQSGKELDPEVVRVFRKMVEEARVKRIPFQAPDGAPDGPAVGTAHESPPAS
jgi:putative nucleotidyltransferase with HDIG domain